MKPQRDQIESWLTFLFDEPTGFGRIYAANLHDCLDKHFVRGEDALAFVTDCMGASGPEEALTLFNDACFLHGGVNPRHYGLNRLSMKAEDGNEEYAVVMRLSVFTDYIDSGIDGEISLFAPIRHTMKPYDRTRVAERLKKMNGRDSWARPDAYLGRRAQGYISSRCCWFTRMREVEETVPAMQETPPADDGWESRARALRDRLGLVHYGEGEDLVLITFRAGVLQNAHDIHVAQPTFADGGNQRFAAVQEGPRYTSHREARWGTTVDLAKFEEGEGDCCGLPERVASPFQVEARVFGVNYVGKLGQVNGKGPAEDERFANWLLRSRSVSALIESILNTVAS